MSYLNNITNFTGRPVSSIHKREQGDLRSKRELEELLKPSGSTRDRVKAEREALPPLEAVSERRAGRKNPRPQGTEAAPSRSQNSNVESASAPEIQEAAGSYSSKPTAIKQLQEETASSSLPAFTPPWGVALQSAGRNGGKPADAVSPAPAKTGDYEGLSRMIKNRYSQTVPTQSKINVTI